MGRRGGVASYSRRLANGYVPLEGSQFHDWIDYFEVAFL